MVLKEIGADNVPQLMVLNKIDLAGLNPGIERDEYGKIQRVLVSAKTGTGMDLLRLAVTEFALEAKKSNLSSGKTDEEMLSMVKM